MTDSSRPRLSQMNASRNAPKPIQFVGLFPDLLGIGGIQEVSRQTVRALLEISIQKRWSLALLGLNDPPGVHDFSAGENKIAFRGFGRSKLRFILAALQNASKKPLIVLAAHPNLAPIALWMKRLAPKTKIIVMAHGVEVWQPLPPRRHAALLAADILLAASASTVQKLTEVQQVPPDKIRKLPWPLDPEILNMADAPAILTTPEAFPPSPVILTVGRSAASEQYKGTDDLLRALAQLRATHKDLTLAAVGAGDDLPRLQKLAVDLGVTTAVRFLSNLSKQELAACYARADIFALPSTGEGFGLVFLEAMAFARPIVAAAAGGSTDLVEHNVNGLLIPPRDQAALAKALDQLLRDPTLRSTLGQRGAEIARHKYRFDLFQSQFAAILAACGLDSLPSP
jgi:phosphatidylinositol alpha-1,6-mannosyltransferase